MVTKKRKPTKTAGRQAATWADGRPAQMGSPSWETRYVLKLMLTEQHVSRGGTVHCGEDVYEEVVLTLRPLDKLRGAALLEHAKATAEQLVDIARTRWQPGYSEQYALADGQTDCIVESLRYDYDGADLFDLYRDAYGARHMKEEQEEIEREERETEKK